MDKSYGYRLKKMRETKNLTLEQVSGSVMSVSQLSKFERGLCDITISKLSLVLKNMYVSLEEYVYGVNEYKMNEFDLYLKNVEKYYITKNIVMLDRIYKQEREKYLNTKHKYNLLNSLMVKSALNRLDSLKFNIEEEKKIIITDYLFSATEWQYYEIILFANTISIYTLDTLEILGKELLNRTIFYSENVNHKRMIMQTIFNIIIICIEEKELVRADYFIKNIELLIKSDSYIAEKCMYKYIKGFYLFIEGKNIEQGRKKMKDVINIYKNIGADDLFNIYTDHYNLIVEKENN